MPLKPAVSININFNELCLKITSIASLVVPGYSLTTILSSPKIRFNKLDLPTFCLPRIDTFIIFLSSFSDFTFTSEIRDTVLSSKSSTFNPCSAEIINGSPNPNS